MGLHFRFVSSPVRAAIHASRNSLAPLAFLILSIFAQGHLFAADADKSPVSPNGEVKKKEVAPVPSPASTPPTQEEMVRRHDHRAALKVFSSMNEEVGAGSHGPWEKDLDVAHPTPEYVQPMGDFPNSIAPAYPTVSQEPWIYNPPADRIPEQLKQAMEGKAIQPTPEQLKQQKFNEGSYVEPMPASQGEESGDASGGTATESHNATDAKKSDPSSGNGASPSVSGASHVAPASDKSEAKPGNGKKETATSGESVAPTSRSADGHGRQMDGRSAATPSPSGKK